VRRIYLDIRMVGRIRVKTTSGLHLIFAQLQLRVTFFSSFLVDILILCVVLEQQELEQLMFTLKMGRPTSNTLLHKSSLQQRVKTSSLLLPNMMLRAQAAVAVRIAMRPSPEQMLQRPWQHRAAARQQMLYPAVTEDLRMKKKDWKMRRMMMLMMKMRTRGMLGAATATLMETRTLKTQP
jgi:hypothetical protein